VTRVRLRHAVAAAALAVLAAGARPASAAPNTLEQIQKEFKAAIDKGTPATVNVVAQNSRFGCSGVMVTHTGLVLSDFDAGLVFTRPGMEPGWSDVVKVRVPDMKSGTFVEYDAHIVRLLKDLDSTLIKIDKPPSGGFKFLAPATADGLRVGSFTFASGNSYGMSSESLPAMTAGVLAAATYTPKDSTSNTGRYEFLYTGAAVNPGVSGGPLLDVQGRLVGVISGCEPVTPDNPFQLLGKVIPIDRLRAAYTAITDCKEAKEAFSEKPPKSDEAKVGETAAIEAVVAHVAAETYQSVASLVVERNAPINTTALGEKGPVPLPRYCGPASAVAVSGDGWLVTSLYNLTNVMELDWAEFIPFMPAEVRLRNGLDAITGITAEFPDGSSGTAKLVAVHEGLGIALLKAEVVGRRPLEPAPPTAFAPGRFVVAVANPYGDKPLPDPFTTLGIVSKRHGDAVKDPWRSQIQTDAACTDGNCGGAIVDFDGKLVGVLTLWNPIMHGRNSGVAFVVPWDKIQLVLLAMKDGRSFRMPRIGVQWPLAGKRFDPEVAPKIDAVTKDGPAEKAGMLAGDVLLKVGDVPVKTIADCTKALTGFYSGDHLAFTVSRGGQTVILDVELGARE
jgi:S1-C subfamily serine protease